MSDRKRPKNEALVRASKVLVGYGSRFGSTQAIAMRIADTVRARGADVDVRAVGDIADCNSYDAVVLGSGVYDGCWTPEASDLVRRDSSITGLRGGDCCSRHSAAALAIIAIGPT